MFRSKQYPSLLTANEFSEKIENLEEKTDELNQKLKNEIEKVEKTIKDNIEILDLKDKIDKLKKQIDNGHTTLANKHKSWKRRDNKYGIYVPSTSNEPTLDKNSKEAVEEIFEIQTKIHEIIKKEYPNIYDKIHNIKKELEELNAEAFSYDDIKLEKGYFTREKNDLNRTKLVNRLKDLQNNINKTIFYIRIKIGSNNALDGGRRRTLRNRKHRSKQSRKK
jgi:small-conductance mechanosensitive channel